MAINNPQQTVAFVLSAMQSSVRLPDDTGGAVLLPSCTSQNAALLNSPTATTGTASFDLRFREGFQTAFKTRSGASDPVTPSAQDIPGVVFNTETGFFNPQYPATDGLHKAGLADHGTRLMARFSQIPPGVKLFVTTSVKTRTISPSTAVLVDTDNAGTGAWAPLSQTTTAVISGEVTGIRPLEITNGTATAVWEVTKVNPAEIDSLLATVLVAYQGGAVPPGEPCR